MISKTIIVLLCVSTLIYCAAGLSTSGNKILDKNGNSILLRGVCRPSFEWSPTGESASLADYQLMAGWGANVVRISLNQDFWLSGASTYSSSYASTIDQQVAWIKQVGMYVILDLHWSDTGNLAAVGAQQNMADSNSKTFWTQVATRYKNDPSVAFELYNEPHDVSWAIWLNGGSSGGVLFAGMQQLYNSVRATGANNLVIVNGLDWAYDLSGVSSGYAVTGTNIAYATHPYDYAGKQLANWDTGFGNLAATYPVIMTEFGQYCATNTYVSDLLAYAAKKGIHWTAWAWYVSGCSFPSIISDWKGTPSSPVGVVVKSYLSSSSSSGSVSAASTTGSASKTASSSTTGKSTSASTTGSSSSSSGVAAVPAIGTCSISSVTISQSLSTSWKSGSDTVLQYNTVITNKCSKKITSLTLSASNWNAVQYWNMQASGSKITLPSTTSIAASGSFSSFGYQNKNSMAVFEVVSVTFA